MGIAIMVIFASSCKKEEVDTPKAVNNVKQLNKRTVIVLEKDMMPLINSVKKLNKVLLEDSALTHKLVTGKISEDEAFEKLSPESQEIVLNETENIFEWKSYIVEKYKISDIRKDINWEASLTKSMISQLQKDFPVDYSCKTNNKCEDEYNHAVARAGPNCYWKLLVVQH